MYICICVPYVIMNKFAIVVIHYGPLKNNKKPQHFALSFVSVAQCTISSRPAVSSPTVLFCITHVRLSDWRSVDRGLCRRSFGKRSCRLDCFSYGTVLLCTSNNRGRHHAFASHPSVPPSVEFTRGSHYLLPGILRGGGHFVWGDIGARKAGRG